MEQVIEKMLCAFEAGKLTRRELVRALAALPAAAGTAVGQLATLPPHTPFTGVSLNHVIRRFIQVQLARVERQFQSVRAGWPGT